MNVNLPKCGGLKEKARQQSTTVSLLAFRQKTGRTKGFGKEHASPPIFLHRSILSLLFHSKWMARQVILWVISPIHLAIWMKEVANFLAVDGQQQIKVT